MKKLLMMLVLSLSFGGTIMAKTINEQEIETKTINKIEYATAKETAKVFCEGCTFKFEKNKSVDKYEEKKEGIITFTYADSENVKYDILFGINQIDARVIKYEKSDINPEFGISVNKMFPVEKTIIKDGKTYIPSSAIEKVLEEIDLTK